MKKELVNIICGYTDVTPGKIKSSTRFVEDLGFDFWDFIGMFLDMEELFHIPLNNPSVPKIRTVGGAVRFLLQAEHKNEESAA